MQVRGVATLVATRIVGKHQEPLTALSLGQPPPLSSLPAICACTSLSRVPPLLPTEVGRLLRFRSEVFFPFHPLPPPATPRPTRLTAGFAHDRPVLLLASIISTILLIVIGGMASGQMTIGEDQGGKEWLILGDPEVSRQDAIEEVIDLKTDLEDDAVVATRSEVSDTYSLTLIFRSRSGNMYTPENLEAMRFVENIFLEADRYPDYWCVLPPPARS